MSSCAACPAVGASDGDRQRLAELDHRFRPALKAYFAKRAPAGMDADDLVQDVFVRLAKRGELTAIRRIEGYLTASRAATGASTRQAPI